jgi:nicotinamidase-related amidase
MDVRPVMYGDIATAARAYASEFSLKPAIDDEIRTGLLAIDCQLTFCHPEFELYVGGRSGNGAVDDTLRLVEFIYRNLNSITAIHVTMDTHTATQIFFDIFFVDEDGCHPTPLVSDLSLDSLQNGTWRANPAAAAMLNISVDDLQQHVLHYAGELAKAGKYSLTIWPYHAMLGGIGHALVPALEEACFFHTQARCIQTAFEMKGGNPLTENYSVLRPEVLTTSGNVSIASKNSGLIDRLLSYDRLIIAGQAKSHCVAWTIEDLLNEINARDPALADKVYLLEDCTSPVVVPGIVDYTEQANAAYARFAAAGMHIVKSTESIESWTRGS